MLLTTRRIFARPCRLKLCCPKVRPEPILRDGIDYLPESDASGCGIMNTLVLALTPVTGGIAGFKS
jgi:hypothetical protein